VIAVGLVVGGGVALGGGSEVAPVDAGSTSVGREDGTVASLQARVDRLPDDWTAWASLGLAHVERARVTGDPSSYPRAELALDRSLEIRPDDNALALTGRAALASARHDFTAAVASAEQATEVNAFGPVAYGVLTDGLVELGRYDEAGVALQRMADLSPDASALTRISYLRELNGDVAGARTALEQARDQSFGGSAASFASFYLGELAFSQGDLDAAEQAYDRAVRDDPSSVVPRAGLAKIAAARGDLADAEALYRDVVDALPLPQYAAELGDLLTSAGRTEEAADQYVLVEAATRLIEANGGNADLEAALFAADHDDPATALRLAQAEHEVRQSIFTDDALGWALHVNGRSAEALPLAERALRLGTKSAALHFHLGMIEAALGLEDRARASLRSALEINPHFSLLQAPVAQAELARLGGAA